MSEFVLVKNKQGDGQILLKISLIKSVMDRSEKAKQFDDEPGAQSAIFYGDSGTWYDSASTASEVLAAIHEAQGVAPRRVEGALAVDMGKGQDASRFALYRSDNGALIRWDTTSQELERVLGRLRSLEEWGTSVVRGEPQEGGWTHLYAASEEGQPTQYQLRGLRVKAELASALRNLTGDAWEVSTVAHPCHLSLTCSHPSRPSLTHRLAWEGDTATPIDEWAAKAAQEAVNWIFATSNPVMINPTLEELSRPLCQCPHHQGGNPACPVHGVGTAWGDLHGD